MKPEKTAIVIGASTGIGRAIAETLAARGLRVFGTSRSLRDDAPRGVSMLSCDVTDERSVSAMVSTVLADAGQIDVLVNNAGVGLVGGAEESSIAQVQHLFDVNLFGAMRVTNAVLPSMRQRREGRIINISSVLGLAPAPYSAHYSAAKHALEGYSESLDHEVRAFNIRVSLVEPAYSRSGFDRNALEPDRRLHDYDRARADARTALQVAMVTADPPALVARTVLVAATAQRPRRRYTAGRAARRISLLRRFAPASLFDKGLRKQMRLP